MRAVSVGKRLLEERERLEMSQVEFFNACGVTKKAQFNFENDRNLPGGAYLIEAARLGVDVQYVLTGVRSLNYSRREQAVVETFRALPPAGQQEAQKMVAAKASAAGGIGPLSVKNKLIMQLYSQGLTKAEIARRMKLTPVRVSAVIAREQNLARG